MSTSILSLLAARHAADVFVAECKDGPSMGMVRGALRLDAWVMLRTWSPVTMIGYEIKASRGDWLRDQKWLEYRDLCHLLYVVSPPGIVQPEEVPADCGLLWTTKSGKRLITKRKAVRRTIELPARLMTYVLMSRTRIVRDMHDANRADRLAAWRGWIADREDRKQLGVLVAGRIGREYREMTAEVERSRGQMRQYDEVRQALVALGFDPSLPAGAWPVRSRLRELETTPTVRALRQAADNCERLAARLEGEHAALDEGKEVGGHAYPA